MRIVVAETPEQYATGASLIKEYFHSWGLEDISEEPELLEELAGLKEYLPPDGCVLIAMASSGEGAGVVALKRVDDSTCEMKRMFVLPAWRRRGVGRALAAGLIERAIDMGYTRMRLDTPSDNLPALSMYRSFGFDDIESYLDPDHGHAHDNWSWLGADLPSSPEERQALRRALLESAYLADDDARAGSGFTGSEERWEKKRRVIVRALHKDGTFLDACCAKGYLMESVERWAREGGLKIEPHGLDVSKRLANEARRRLPQWAARIHVGDALTWKPPQRYDYVYVLDDIVLAQHRRAFFERMLDEVVAPQGRLIVGIYSLDEAQTKIKELRSWLGNVHAVQGEEVEGSPTRATTVVWIDA